MASIVTWCVAPARALDQVVLINGSSVSGEVAGVSNGQLVVNTRTANGGAARLPFSLSQIKSVSMSPPAAVMQAKSASPAAVVSALEPVVKQYAGVPADWVLDAMSRLADAYDAQKQSDKSAAIYAQINQLYPNSPYQNMAIIGSAKLSLQQGKTEAVLAAVKPLISKANQNLAPSAAEGRLYAGAFLVYGQALEAQKLYPQALEAYLTVKTMFYQNPALVDQADQLAQKLKAQDPGVGVD